MTAGRRPAPTARSRWRSPACCAAPASPCRRARSLAFAEALGAVGLDDRARRLLGRPGDAGAPARGHRRLRPGVRRRSGSTPSRPATSVEEPEPEPITLAVDDDDEDDDGAGRRRAERRPDDRAALQRRRGAAPQGLRRLQRRRAGRGPPADGTAALRRRAAPLAAAGADDAATRPARPAPHRAGRAAHRRRADAPPLPRRRRRGTAGSCCCSTSAARWSRTPGPCSASSRPRSPAGSGSRRSPSAPG